MTRFSGGKAGSPTAGTSQFVLQLRLDDLSEPVRWGAKKAILDCLGVALAAGNSEVGRVLVSTFRRVDGGVSVFGHGLRTDAMSAAFINGGLSHALDYDDSSEGLYGHPSAALVPALMAMGEQERSSGSDFLTSYVAGFEVGSKFGRTMPKKHYDVGWHNSSTIGSLAAAAATARLLLLELDATSSAIGLAASFASGLRQNFGTMAKPLHLAAAARNGVIAGLLARNGARADLSILEGKYGFFEVFSMGEESDLDSLVPSLGNPFELESPGVRIKIYPACTATHRPVEAALALVETYNINPSQIADVECQVVYEVPEVLNRPMARTGDEARFSLNYCVARAIISRGLELRDFDEDRVLQPEVQHLMSKIRTVVPETGQPGAFDREFAVVSIKLADGQKVTKTIYEQRGHPLATPLSWEEVCDKFVRCAGSVLEHRTSQVIDLIARLEDLTDVSVLGRALATERVQS